MYFFFLGSMVTPRRKLSMGSSSDENTPQPAQGQVKNDDNGMYNGVLNSWCFTRSLYPCFLYRSRGQHVWFLLSFTVTWLWLLLGGQEDAKVCGQWKYSSPCDLIHTRRVHASLHWVCVWTRVVKYSLHTYLTTAAWFVVWLCAQKTSPASIRQSRASYYTTSYDMGLPPSPWNVDK